MWTALVAVGGLDRRRRALCGVGGAHARAWRLAVDRRPRRSSRLPRADRGRSCRSTSPLPGSGARRDPRRCASASAGRCGSCWREYRALTGAAKRMMFYRLLLTEPPAAPSRAAGAARCTACCAMQASGSASRATSRRRASRRSTRSRTARRSHRSTRSPTSSRSGSMRCWRRPARASSSIVVAQHGRAGRARVPVASTARQSCGVRSRSARRYRGSVHAWLMFGTSLAQLRPGNAWLDALQRGVVRACRRSCRSGRGTTRWSRRRLSSRVDGADNIELVGRRPQRAARRPRGRTRARSSPRSRRRASRRGATSGSPA